MVEDLIRKLLEAGVHFGHQTRRWNPKMKKYIFGQRAGIYIIDLEKTVDYLNQAADFLYEIAIKGGTVLFIGTKKQAQMIVEEQAQRSEMPFVKNRWLGGQLTNFQTVRKSIDRLQKIEDMSKNGIWENLKKKEIAALTKEKEKLLFHFGGIREMNVVPDAVIIIDPKKEEIAVKEAKKLGIPIVAIVDTNCDPEVVDFPIPGNDDALKSINLIVSILSEKIIKGRKEFQTQDLKTKAKDAKKEGESQDAAAQKQDDASTDAAQEDKDKAEEATA